MSERLRVIVSPITNTIFAGYVKPSENEWCAGKQDVTVDACAAVAEHIIRNNAPVIVSANGCPVYEITVKRIAGSSGRNRP